MGIAKFIAPFALCCYAFAAAPTWNYSDDVELKKDQHAVYQIAIDSKIFTLDFRWTLFVNDGLVMLYKYEKFPYQNILYRDAKLNSFRITLKNRFDDSLYPPYALVMFKEFHPATKSALFSVYIKDDKRPISAERVWPKAN